MTTYTEDELLTLEMAARRGRAKPSDLLGLIDGLRDAYEEITETTKELNEALNEVRYLEDRLEFGPDRGGDE